MTHIPGYAERRIRRPIPTDSHVVTGSTPVVSFGDAHTATTATLGLNPSRIEFLDSSGRELTGSSRRLATHRSLGTSDIANAPLDVIAQVLDDCRAYFDRNPYCRWFNQLEPILNACGVSYYKGSACHLDLVQWATDPTWGKLGPPALRARLLEEDGPFLVEQLSNENIRLLLVNGMGVVRHLQQAVPAALDEVDPIVGYGYQDTRLFTGTLLGRVRIVAWSTNIQSSFGVTSELRAEIAAHVAELARQSPDPRLI
jgi:hypothetical protein